MILDKIRKVININSTLTEYGSTGKNISQYAEKPKKTSRICMSGPYFDFVSRQMQFLSIGMNLEWLF